MTESEVQATDKPEDDDTEGHAGSVKRGLEMPPEREDEDDVAGHIRPDNDDETSGRGQRQF